MHYKGKTWYKSKTVVTLPELDGVNIQFGKICDSDAKGAVKTTWRRKEAWKRSGDTMIREETVIYAKPITPKGWSRTNMMYGKDFVRNGEVRIKVYLYLGNSVYTTSWVHEEKTRMRHS